MSTFFYTPQANLVITTSSTVTTRPDSSPLQIGDCWIDLTALLIKRWTGTIWTSGTGNKNTCILSSDTTTTAVTGGVDNYVIFPASGVIENSAGYYNAANPTRITNTSGTRKYWIATAQYTNSAGASAMYQRFEKNRLNIPESAFGESNQVAQQYRNNISSIIYMDPGDYIEYVINPAINTTVGNFGVNRFAILELN